MLEKNVGSWAWPAMLSGFTVVAFYYALITFGRQLWLLCIIILGVVLFAMAMANLFEYISERRAMALDQQTNTLARTADSVLMAEARMLAAQSPELAGELARRVGRPDLILFPARQGRKAQIKLAGSDVTLQFALKALNMSDDVNMVAQRQFSEATYLYDSNREMPDRKQWQQFNWLLAREGMVQRYVPNMATNSAPMWLPPWTPQRILDNWLLPAELVELLNQYVQEEPEEN